MGEQKINRVEVESEAVQSVGDLLLSEKHDEDIEIEMALLSLLAARDVGEATEPIQLDTLSPTEKQVLLQMLRDRIGFVESAGRAEATGIGITSPSETAP